MPSAGRQTICISTQAGCAVDCHFCLTARLGLIRNFTAGEMAGQVLALLEDHRESLAPRTNVVLMGRVSHCLISIAVMAAVRLMLDPTGWASPRGTSRFRPAGLCRELRASAAKKCARGLRFHSTPRMTNSATPSCPLTANIRCGICWRRAGNIRCAPGNGLTFEYVLLGGYNDAAEDARRVARLIDGLRAKVNLIPWNPGALPYRAPEAARVEQFRNVLVEKGVPAFIRYSRGGDISAACGQLALLETPA